MIGAHANRRIYMESIKGLIAFTLELIILLKTGFKRYNQENENTCDRRRT